MTVGDLADQFWEYLEANDHWAGLWRGRVSHLAAFTDADPAAMAQRRQTYLDFAGQARQELNGDVSAAEEATLSLVEVLARLAATEAQGQNEIIGVNPPLGYFTLLKIFLPRQPLTTESEGEQYLTKLEAIGKFIEQFAALTVSGADEGRVALARHVAQTVSDIDQYLDASEDVFQSQPAPSEGFGNRDWAKELETAVNNHLRPALVELRDTLTEHVLPLARPDELPGVCHIPGGHAIYQNAIDLQTTLTLTPVEIHAIGLDQVKRLENEYREIAGPLLGTTDLDAIYEHLRSDPELHYETAAQLITDATKALKRATEIAPAWFGRTPRTRCVAEATMTGALAYYSPAPDDSNRPATFFFNASVPSEWATFSIEAITFHEAIPGHHLQIAHALENPDLHPLHREANLSAYSEGWGLYSERLADEMNLYSTPWDRVGMLFADSMRACRLVADTGIHALGWSRQEAINYLTDHSPLAIAQIEAEIDRYIGWPGQALCYMIGRLEIEDIRSVTEERLGDKFDLRSFHDIVLSQGVVTLPTLRRMCDEWQPI